MRKTVSPDSFGFDVPSVGLVHRFNNGALDRGVLHKRAAMFDEDIKNIIVKPGYSYLHLITMGAEERYGCNTQGDAFNRAPRALRLPLPKTASAIMLDGGLRDYHPSFTQCAAVYKQHKNKYEKGTPSGYIVKAAYNNDMDRGELIIGVDDDLWRDELHKVAQEKPIYFSMGCDVPFDICSICGNVRKDLKEDCEHAGDLCKTASDGTVVCRFNTRPILHDISGVRSPADKIAFGLRKVASDDSREPVMAASVPGPWRELLTKMASLEKRVEAEGSDLVSAFTPKSGFKPLPEELLEKSDPLSLLSALKGCDIIVPFETFARLVKAEPSDVVPAKARLAGIFNQMADDPGVDEYLRDFPYDLSSSFGLPYRAADGLTGSHSLAPELVRRRVIVITLRGDAPDKRMPEARVLEKKACSLRDDTVGRLAGEYAKYAMAVARDLPDEEKIIVAAAVRGGCY